jgi:hypothetical protein
METKRKSIWNNITELKHVTEVKRISTQQRNTNNLSEGYCKHTLSLDKYREREGGKERERSCRMKEQVQIRCTYIHLKKLFCNNQHCTNTFHPSAWPL